MEILQIFKDIRDSSENWFLDLLKASDPKNIQKFTAILTKLKYILLNKF